GAGHGLASRPSTPEAWRGQRHAPEPPYVGSQTMIHELLLVLYTQCAAVTKVPFPIIVPVQSVSLKVTGRMDAAVLLLIYQRLSLPSLMPRGFGSSVSSPTTSPSTSICAPAARSAMIFLASSRSGDSPSYSQHAENRKGRRTRASSSAVRSTGTTALPSAFNSSFSAVRGAGPMRFHLMPRSST